MNTDIINTIAVNAIPVMIAAAVALYQFVMQFLPSAKHAQLQSLVSNVAGIANTVVKSTEQFLSGEAGPVKKAAAANDISAILNATGIRNVPTELINNAIEAAVYGMNQFKPATAAVAAISAPVVTSAPVAPSIPVASEASASIATTTQTVQNTANS